MRTWIEVIGETLARSNIPVEYNESEMLVTAKLPNNRRQVVKMRAVYDQSGKQTILRLQSRVCIARGTKMIRSALKANAESDWGAYALDMSLNPPVVDVVYGYVMMPESGLVPRGLSTVLWRVAAFADAAEQHISGGDVF